MIKKATIPWSAKQLTRSIEKGTIDFDNAVQRGYVWDNARKSLLIHSMIEGFPIPAFFAAKNNGIYSMLDGKQRSNAISKFMNNEFELEDVPEVTLEDGTTVDINGLTFEELDEELQDRIKDYSLTVYYFEDITDEEINDMFFRLNNGKPLSAIELTRVKAKSLETIQEIANHDIFKNALTEKAFNKYTHEDLVIKSWIVLYNDYPSLETKYVRPVMAEVEITDEQKENIIEVYDKLLEVYLALKETGDKTDNRVAKRILTRTHMISLLPLVNKLVNSEEWNTEQFTEWVRHFFGTTKSTTIDEEYNAAARAGSGKVENVRKRLEVIDNNFKEFVIKGQ